MNNNATKSHLTVVLYNIRSLLNKFANFKENIVRRNPDIILIVETWLSDDVNDDFLHINNYNFFKYNRHGGRGGGVAIYIKSKFKCSSINYLSLNNTEQLWISLMLNNKLTCVGVAYRPPKHSVLEFLEILENNLSILAPKFEYTIFGGDLNIDYLNILSNSYKKLIELQDSFGLVQIVNEPTRIGTTSATILDLIFCSDNLNVTNSSVIDLPNMSDHNVVLCDIDTNEITSPPFLRTYRSYKYFNPDNFYRDLQLANIEQIFYVADLDIKLETFNSLILNVFDKHAPLVTSRISKKYCPWLTDNIKHMISLRKKALQKFKKTKNKTDGVYYKDLKNFVNTAIKNEKRAYLQFKLNNNNHKTLWKDLKELNIYDNSQNNVIPDHLCEVNDINRYFINSQNSNEPHLDTLDFYNTNIRTRIDTFNFKLISNETVLKHLSTIKTKAAGCDDLNINMIHLCCPYILPFLTHIINSCIEKKYFPQCWKISHIIPMPKLKNITEMKDLRPISILSVLSKLFEKILNEQIREHLNKFHILPALQSGFRPGHSCASALLKVTDDILSAIDKNKLTVLVLLDYSKAFDLINHRLLLAVLHYFGFGADALALLSSYLIGRKQRVLLNSIFSEALEVKSGVPQGSILGPLLFTIYTSNFYSYVNYCEAHYYADDTQLYFSFDISNLDDACSKINADLQSLLLASSNHSLTINPNKSAVMLFGRKSQREQCLYNLHIVIDNEPLNVVDITKNLGLQLDPTLKFSSHITKCLKRAYCNLKLLYGSNYVLDKKSKIILCNSLVLSHFNYLDVVYHSCLTMFDQSRIQRVQNACIRFIFGIRKYQSVSHKLLELKWLNMKERRILHMCCFYHKVITSKTPSYLYSKIAFGDTLHDLNTRYCKRIFVPRHTTAIYKSSFSYSICKYYNAIPDNLKKLHSDSFKIHLNKAFLDKTLLF